MAQLPAPGIFTTMLQLARWLVGYIPELFNNLLTIIAELQETGVVIYQLVVIGLIYLTVTLAEKLGPIVKKLFNWGMKKFE